MNYIGLSYGFHDAAASVIDDEGNILFAGHSERYSGIKHDKNLSIGLVNDVLTHVTGDIELHYYERPFYKFLRQLRSGEGFKIPTLCIRDNLTNTLGKTKINTHNHHLSHAAAGFQTSPFNDATVVVVDAIGEFDTITIWDARYDKNGVAKYKKLYTQKYPNSIGLFYSAMTQRVGLKPMDEEYILMGMAAYGKPIYADKIDSLLIDNLPNFKFSQNLHIGVDDDFLKGADNMDIASSAQYILECFVSNVMLKARMIGKSTNLVYGGGVALNCLANRLLGDYYEHIWIMPNPGDAGSSIGAAALGYGCKLHWDNAFLGHDISGR